MGIFEIIKKIYLNSLKIAFNICLQLDKNYRKICTVFMTFWLTHLISLLIAEHPKNDSYDDGKLIIVTDSQILAIPLHRCNSEKINSCR